MMKKVLYIFTIIGLLIITKVTPAIAAPAGSTCQVKGDCNYGLVCAQDTPSTKVCIPGVPANGSCASSPEVCGNGYTCKITDPAFGPRCVSSIDPGNAAGPGNGVLIGIPFLSNFSNGIPLTIGLFVSSMLGQLYILALILVLVYLVWGAYRYMLSAGDPKAVAAARGHLTWAVVGMIIIFLSYGLFQLINSLINNIYS